MSMGRDGLNFEQVAAVLDELFDTSHKLPTQQQLREQLGTGSFTTIKKHYDRWLTTRLSLASPKPTEQTIPDEFQDALTGY